jgi:uncharacterized protein (DUF433 family)
MQLEEYFDFLSPTDIRLKGSRIGIETILWDYLRKGLVAEQIVINYPSLTFAQVYATLTYYWANQADLDNYLRMVEHILEEQREEQRLNPSPAVRRLQALARQRDEAAMSSKK